MMDDQRGIQAAKWWQIWRKEIESPKPDVARASHAAKQLAAFWPSSAQLRQWLEAIAEDVDDPLTCEQCQALLSDFLQAQSDSATSDAITDPRSSDRFREVRYHLMLCPYCTTAYREVAEWMVASEMDVVPVANGYPSFDFSFLAATPAPVTPSPTTLPMAARIEEAVAAGKRWLDDAVGGLFVLFGPGLQSQPATAWAIKSGEAGSLLAQTVIPEGEVGNWEITVAAYAQEGAGGLCQIEMALYQPETVLAGIPVVLAMGRDERQAETDAGGVVTFGDVPVARLGEVVVHVALGQGAGS